MSFNLVFSVTMSAACNLRHFILRCCCLPDIMICFSLLLTNPAFWRAQPPAVNLILLSILICSWRTALNSQPFSNYRLFRFRISDRFCRNSCVRSILVFRALILFRRIRGRDFMLGYWVKGKACNSPYNFLNGNSCKAITAI